MRFVPHVHPLRNNRPGKFLSISVVALACVAIAAIFVFFAESSGQAHVDSVEGRIVKGEEAMREASLNTGSISTASASGFRMCNKTASNVGIAVGYKDKDGWATEGWWNLPPQSCETLLAGALVSRYYYVYALDYDKGGEWKGETSMCTKPKSFTIRDVTDCQKRGYEATKFFEVDTGNLSSWTVQLTETGPEGASAQ
jgi:uncharacterized membrane protein